MLSKFKLFIVLIIIISIKSTYSSEKISNYKNYKKTKINFSLEEIASELNYPWGLTFIDEENLLVTEKNGRLLQINIKNGQKKEIKHNIQSIRYDGESIAYQQGGLLDIYHHEGYIYFTYSHDFKEIIGADNKPSKASSTAIARGILINDEIVDLQILLLAQPKLHINKHFGSRIAIKDDMLFVSFGERGMGMIAQDPTKHPGSIIRIKTNGDIPPDNPKFKGHDNWLPEIYQIGVRNPQGMTVSPHDGEIYFSNHGPRGGDFIGKINFAGNYGWKEIAWGGTEYTGIKIGKVAFKKKFDKPLKTWVPSMAVGNIKFYDGEIFPEWKGDLFLCATKAQMLVRLNFENNIIINEEIILQNKIGRIRDFEIDKKGNIFLISDESNSELWKLSR